MNNDSEKTSTPSTGATPTLVDVERLNRVSNLATSVCKLPGVNAELGVYRGGSAQAIAEACPSKPLHLFDTFEGLPSDDTSEGGHAKGEFVASFKEVMKTLQRYPFIEYHVGFFPDTTKGLEHLYFSFVHVDADIFQSTEAAIEFFLPRMVPGGIMVFDDYDWPPCPGVKELVDKWFPAADKARQQAWVRL